jgi:hypothetical protein
MESMTGSVRTGHTEESGTFDFQVYMYDEWTNLEDYGMYRYRVEPMTGSADETINVDNSVGDDSDGVNNDMGFWLRQE